MLKHSSKIRTGVTVDLSWVRPVLARLKSAFFGILLLLLVAPQAAAAIVRVQGANNRVAGQTTIPLTLGATPSQHSFVGVMLFAFPSMTWGAGACVDNQSGNTYTLATTITDAANNISAAIYFSPDIGAASGAFTVTCTAPASAFMVGSVSEFTGVNTSTTPAGVLTNSGDFLAPSTNPPATGTVSPGSSAERLALAVVGLSGSQTAITIAGTGTWTEEAEELSLSFQPGEADSQIATASSYEAHWTIGSSTNWVTLIAVFDAGGGGPAASTKRLMLLGIGDPR